MRRALVLMAVCGLSMSCFAQGNVRPQDRKRTLQSTIVTPQYKVGLQPGDKAPKVSAKRWLRGEPLKEWPAGKVGVLEFMAARNPAAERTEKEIVELLKELPDVSVVSLHFTVTPETVKKSGDLIPGWVAENPQISWTVGEDDVSRTQTAWITASGNRVEAMVFVIDQKGNLAWFGRSGEGLGKVVKRVHAGTWDSAVFKKGLEIRRTFQTLRSEGKVEELKTAAQEFFDLDPELNGEGLVAKISAMLMPEQDHAAAYSQAREYIAGPLHNDAPALDALSRTILLQPKNESRDVSVAVLASERANEVLNSTEHMVITQLAQAYFEAGDKPKAMEWIQKAIDLAPPTERGIPSAAKLAFEKPPVTQQETMSEERRRRKQGIAPPNVQAPIERPSSNNTGPKDENATPASPADDKKPAEAKKPG